MDDDRSARGEGWWEVMVGDSGTNIGLVRMLILIFAFIVMLGITLWAIWPT
jgi:hypothetical protein